MRALALVLGLVVVGSASPARAAPEKHALEMGPAPAGCWTMQDGCPARSGATRTPGVRGPLVEAWSLQLGAERDLLYDEPRVWGSHVYVSVQRPDQSHVLYVLRLSDGRPLADPISFPAHGSLDLSVWDDVVLVRSAPDRLDAYRLRAGRLEPFWSAKADNRFYSPMLCGDRVYALDGPMIRAWKLGSDKELWRLGGDEYRGRLALRGDDLYALRVDEVGNAKLVVVVPGTGRVRTTIFAGASPQPGLPPRGDLAEIAVLESDVFVRFPYELRASGTKPFQTSWIRRTAIPGLPSVHLDSRLLSYGCLPVAAGRGWLVTLRGERGGPRLVRCKDDPHAAQSTLQTVLASDAHHPDYARVTAPYSVAGGVAYAGRRAFDLASGRILWEGAKPEHAPLAGSPARFIRPVPASETLLVVPSGRRLTALRPEGDLAARALFFGPAAAPGGTEPVRGQGVVFFTDDTWHDGAFEIAPDHKTLTTLRRSGRQTRAGKHAMDDVVFVLDTDGNLVFASSCIGLERDLARYHFLRHAADYDRLAREAHRTWDPALMRRLIAAAAARGVTERRLKFPRQQLAGLVRRPRKTDEKRRARILEEEKKLSEEDARITRTALESTLDDSRWPVQETFLRRLTAEGLGGEKAARIVKARLPSFLVPPEPFRPLEWIDLADVLWKSKARRLEKPDGDAATLTHEEREYGAALRSWRKDLVALESGDLLVLTPLAKPGRIGGCLSMGTLVCEALNEVFQGGRDVRTDPWPLILRLYESKEEYLAASSDSSLPAGERAQMEWTSGHFDPQKGFSLIYLPDRRKAWEQVMATYAHELTHHWIDERCPLFKASDRKYVPASPGYWIVEGMATFLEEFRWNLEARTWSATNPHADSLDVVANAGPEQLLPWRKVYGLTNPAFWRLKRSDEQRKVFTRWCLGTYAVVSEARMFYDQAAATCHYLYHAGAKERAALLEYVRLRYTGNLVPKTDTIQKVFGCSPDELGRRVVAYARSQAAER